MYECHHHAEYLQFLRVEGGVGGIHRQQGDSGFKLQAFNGELAICFCDDNSKRPARTVLTGMRYSIGSATRQGSSSLTSPL